MNVSIHRRKTLQQLIVLVALIIVVAFSCLLSNPDTSAWLNAIDNTPQNVFLGSDLDISFAEESGTAYTIIPGDRMAKNPNVTVLEGSEPCYLFLKTTGANTDNYLDYYVADGWIPYGGFAVDGELDSLYQKNTTWYFDSTDDTYNDYLKRYISGSGTIEHTGGTTSNVKLWVAYDSNYVYAYIKMYTTSDTAAVRMSYDPDPNTNDSSLSMTQSNASSLHGDAGFRVERADLKVVLEGGFGSDKIAYNDAGYFYTEENLKPFTFTEDAGEGFGFEVRLPRNDDDSNTFKLNFAAESTPSSSTDHAWTFGPEWWFNRSSMRTFTFNDSDNPFTDDKTEGYYYRLVGDADGEPLAADQTFYALRGLNATDAYGGDMNNGYVQFRTTTTNGTELTNQTLSGVSGTISFKATAVQQKNLTLAKAFEIAKPKLDS